MILIAGKIVYFSMIRYLLTKWNLIRNLENHENEGRSANFHFQVGGVSLLGYVEKIFIFKGGGWGTLLGGGVWQRMVQFEGRGKRDEGSSLRWSVEHTLMYTGGCQHRVRINKIGLHMGDVPPHSPCHYGKPWKAPFNLKFC